MVVTEGDPHLQPGGHTHAVLPVQQGGHEPVQGQPADLPAAAFPQGLPRQGRHLRQGLLVAGLDIVLHLEALPQLWLHHRPSELQVRTPGEGVRLQQLRPLKPGVAAKHLVSALPGKGHRVPLRHLPAEIQQGGVHIRHPRQVLGLHGLREQLEQGGDVAPQHPVSGTQCPDRLLYPGSVGVRLESGRLEMLPVAHIVKGVGLQGLPPLLLIGPGGHRGNDGGVQPARQEGAQGHVAD